MKMLRIALAAATLAGVSALGTGALNAQSQPYHQDTDGVVTWADFKANAEAAFARLDVNHDGVIDRTDRQALREQRRSRQDAGGDTSHDGQAYEGQANEGPPPPGGGERAKGGGMGNGGMRGGRGGMGGMMMMMLRGADTDHDGKITRAEYDASVKVHFDAMDTNHDGQVSPEERKIARDRMRAEMQERMHERGGDTGGDSGGMRHGPDHGAEGDDMPPPPQ